MDRRVDVEALRSGLDAVLAAAEEDTVVIQRDGRDAFVLTRVEAEVDWLSALQADAKARGLDRMTMEEIDAEIEAYRRDKAAEAKA